MKSNTLSEEVTQIFSNAHIGAGSSESEVKKSVFVNQDAIYDSELLTVDSELLLLFVKLFQKPMPVIALRN